VLPLSLRDMSERIRDFNGTNVFKVEGLNVISNLGKKSSRCLPL
jgi:hypothetical protein